MIEEGLIRLFFNCHDHLPQLAPMANRYKDRVPDVAHLCLIQARELNSKHSLITLDADFRVYRRNKLEAVRLIFPPVS